MTEGYCVKCRTKRIMKNAHEVDLENNRRAMKGECPECGTNMFVMVGKKESEPKEE